MIKTALMDHQQRAVQFLLDRNGSGCLWMEIGTGKTLTALSAFHELRHRHPALRLLVVCPLSLIEAAWGDDIAKHTDLTYHNLRVKGPVPPVDVYLINYEGLLTRKLAPTLDALLQTYDVMCVLDESSRIKGYKGTKSNKTGNRLFFLRNQFKARVVMSGTPAPNTPQEYWPQVTFVNDVVFPRSFYAFRNEYFHLARNGQVMQTGQYISKDVARNLFSKGWDYRITDDNRRRMVERMAPLCFYAYKKDCLDLPEQTDEVRKIPMTADQLKTYKQMMRDYITEIKGADIVATVALAKLQKLRQICSGFAITPEGKAVDLPSNPKLTELIAVLEEAGDQQAIIWCEYQHEIETLAAALGNKATTLYGATKCKDEPIAAFKDGRAKYLIAHPKSAGHGLTFTNCSLQVFYTLSYSYENYTQARGRTHRAGQKNPCTYVHLLMEGSVEESVFRVIKRKGSQADIIKEIISCH